MEKPHPNIWITEFQIGKELRKKKIKEVNISNISWNSMDLLSKVYEERVDESK